MRVIPLLVPAPSFVLLYELLPRHLALADEFRKMLELSPLSCHGVARYASDNLSRFRQPVSRIQEPNAARELCDLRLLRMQEKPERLRLFVDAAQEVNEEVFAFMNRYPVVHVRIVAMHAPDGLDVGIYPCRKEDAGDLRERRTDADGTMKHFRSCRPLRHFERIVRDALPLFERIRAVRYVHHIRRKDMTDNGLQGFVGNLVRDGRKQFLVVDVVKVLSKVDFEHITIRPVPAVMPSKMFLEPLASERDALAFEARAVVVHHVPLQDRNEDAFDKRVLREHITRQQCLDQAKVSAFAQAEHRFFTLPVRAVLEFVFDGVYRRQDWLHECLRRILPSARLVHAVHGFQERVRIRREVDIRDTNHLFSLECRADSIHARRQMRHGMILPIRKEAVPFPAMPSCV